MFRLAFRPKLFTSLGRLAPVVILFLFPSQINAADLSRGLKAYDQGDCRTAMRELRPLARRGDATAQTYLGFMYYRSCGVKRDFREAARWHRRAADQGHAVAQQGLGLMYRNGEGLTQNFEEALKWFRRSAEQNNIWGQDDLGGMYEYGLGVKKDYPQAAFWYQRAAENGLPRAKFNLGRLYFLGRGVPRGSRQSTSVVLGGSRGGPRKRNEVLGDHARIWLRCVKRHRASQGLVRKGRRRRGLEFPSQPGTDVFHRKRSASRQQESI